MAAETPQPSPQEQEPGLGLEPAMTPLPDTALPEPSGGRLQGRGAIVSGGDGGIGRAVAIAFAREGADVAILYLDEHDEAAQTRALVEEEGRSCLQIPGDVADEGHCREAVRSMFFMTKAALGHMGEGAAIVNTSSVAAYTGSPRLIDYSAAEGAVVAFTRALSARLGRDGPLGPPGHPAEIAPSYAFLASDDAAHITGQVIHPNGGTIVNG